MKEIRFRIWNVDKKKMSDTFDLYDYASDRDSEYGKCELNIEGNVLMQYTGLKDKHGKEIYEADIVDNGNGGCVVFWNENYWAWWVESPEKDFFSSLSDFESDADIIVIGNIYNNPELLTGRADNDKRNV